MGYGYGTKSWRNSSEKHQLDAERADLTAKYEAGELKLPEGDLPLLRCTCLQRPSPHEVKIHKLIQTEAKGRRRWPWSLKWVELEEYQNAGKAEKRN